MCHSASIVFADFVQSKKIGLIAGESPGGYTIVSSGDGISVDLPYSKSMSFVIIDNLNGNYKSRKYEYLKPDIPIEPTFEEWLYDKYDALPVLIEKIKKNDF